MSRGTDRVGRGADASRHAVALVGAFLLLGTGAGDVNAQVSGGPIERVQSPRVPGLSIPASGLDVLSGPWDPLGLLGTPSVSGAGPFAAARAAEAAAVQASDIIVLPALFSDSEEPFVLSSEIQRILFDGPREGGTFSEFYQEMSRGAISPSGSVAPWVRTDVTMLEAAGFHEEGHGWIGPRRADYVVQAVARADPYVDYTLYDNDGPDGVPDSGDDDGFIDVLVVEFLEVAGSCGGPSIWPHFSAVFEGEGENRKNGVPTDDIGHDGTPIRAFTYLTQSVTNCTGQEPQGPNVIAHEYGHSLGLPDWYQAVEGIQPWKRHWNVGCFGLMGAGSWGCGTGAKVDDFGPTHMSAYSKAFLGWMEVETVVEAYEKEFVLEPAQTTGRTLHFPMTPSDRESFYIEYRPLVGYDAAWLPAGGVIMYHRDHDHQSRNVPAGLPPAKPLHVVEADGDHALRKVEAQGGNRGVAEDVFGIDGRTGPYSSAPGPVRLLLSDGSPAPLILHSVEVEGDVARLVISHARYPKLMASEAGVGLRVLEEGTLATFRLAGGALPYTIHDADPNAQFTATVAGTEGVLVGVPQRVGTFDLSFEIQDARGVSATATISLDVEDSDIDLQRLVDAVAGVEGAGAHAGYLDGEGNRNGRADVGDLRSYLRRAGLLP